MNQFNWNHIDQTGKFHKIGLLHGSRTGHVLIHVNGKISSIDFSVLETKQYSFFINEELIELNIIRHDDHFEYTMEINEDVKTPLNEQRKVERKKMGFQTLAFFAVMMFVVVGGTVWMMNSAWYNEKDVAAYGLLERAGKFTKAKLFFDGGSNYDYHFVDHRHDIIRGSAKLASHPIQNGDEYMVQYLLTNPKINKIVFDKPTNYQIKKSAQEGFQICRKADQSKSEEDCSCIVDAVYEMGGYTGLLSYIYQKLRPVDNALFNGESAKIILESEEFKNSVEICKR